MLRVPVAVLGLVGVLCVGCESVGDAITAPEPERDPRIVLKGQLSVAAADMIHSDVWGYVDAATGTEYALVGGLRASATSQNGPALFIIDVSDPAAPVLAAQANVPGFDMKTWRHYAYTVTGHGDEGPDPEGRILDLSDPANPRVVGRFPSAHNLFITDDGLMILEAPGVRIFDLRPDPTNPVLLWNDDLTQGHDAAVIGTRLYDFHGRGGTNIYDIAAPSDPQLLGHIDRPSITYHHSGWTTENGRFLFLCDELAQDSTADVTVWDVENPADPRFVAAITDTTATVHNLYIVEDFAYLSYYTAGFRLYDVSEPTQPRLVDEYDTAPAFNGAGFRGAWGVYPFTPSGHVYISDMQNGLFVFALER